jgi:DNA helicase-2/ATP-dependent DNA helicase PcrA
VQLLARATSATSPACSAKPPGCCRKTTKSARGCRRKFRFIQVDEYQDTNKAQNEIVELLAGAEDNVLAVGDADQSIYEWRGATPDAIPQFIRNGNAKTGNCTIVKLGLNYRSTPQIIATADKLIRHCAGRTAIEFDTRNAPGELPKCVKFEKPELEAEAVGASIENTIKSATPPRQIAVFFRTNDMSRLIEQALAKRQIPYQVVGSGSYYDRMEVKDVLVDATLRRQPARRHQLPSHRQQARRGHGRRR